MRILTGAMDVYFMKYGIVVGAILAVAGVILVILRLAGFKDNKIVSHSWKAYCSWLVMTAVIFGVLAIGKTAFVAGMLVLSFFCIREFAQATGLYADKWFMSVIYGNVAMLYWCVLAGWFSIFIIMPVFGIIMFFMIPVFRNETAGMLQKAGLSIVALTYLGWFPAHLAYLSNTPDMAAYVIFLALGVTINDMVAYITGSIFGRTKLIPNISPNKTVAGTVGSAVFVALYIFAVKNWLPGFTPVVYALSFLIIWIGGTLGDLVISVIKRDVGVKDMGSFIPGHGGLLDRVDSLLLAAPLFFHMLCYFVRFPDIKF